MQKVPYLLVIGDKEVAEGQVAVRARGGKNLGPMSIKAFCDRLADDVAAKRVQPVGSSDDESGIPATNA